MKYSLLEIVQSVLNAMDSDPVNSIADTEEALQVGQVAEEVYYQLVDNQSKDWSFLKEVIELQAVSDSTHPNYLKLPENVSEVYWIKYDVTQTNDDHTKYRTLEYRSPEEFLNLVHGRKSDQSDVDTITDYNSVDLFIKNDEPPTVWTTFDDEHIVTDSYDSAEESSHQASKSIAYIAREPTFTQDDEHIPDMPSKMFPTYLAWVKRACFYYFKQQDNRIDERAGRRGRNVMLNKEYRSNGTNFKGFGRK